MNEEMQNRESINVTWLIAASTGLLAMILLVFLSTSELSSVSIMLIIILTIMIMVFGFLFYKGVKQTILDVQSVNDDAESKLNHTYKQSRLVMAKYAKLKQKFLAQREKMEELSSKVDEAGSVEKELKDFVDTQIKTNEQLLIAETKLKSLLEKEQESKSILNQTIERLKETQGQLVHSEKMASLGQLTAGIAHEINNPINFVYNGIESLKTSLGELSEVLDKYNEMDQGKDPKEVLPQIIKLKDELEYSELRDDLSQLILDIKEGAVRTIEIVKGLRVFSRLDEEDRKEANINECLEATLILLNNKIKNKITLIKELDASIPQISCYPGQLNQVFMNIINNAIQAIPEDKQGAEIKVKTELSDGNVVISLGDNGSGMRDEVKSRIFEPFFTTKPVGVGTGLGMSISYGIIEKHSGNITVDSELGKGTTFFISLPKEVSNVLPEAV